MTRLTDCLAGGAVAGDLERAIDRAVTELGDARAASRSLRGEARAAFIARLQAVDDELMAAARAATPPRRARRRSAREAERDLAAFRGRMSADDYARAVEAATMKLLRERLKLPDICLLRSRGQSRCAGQTVNHAWRPDHAVLHSAASPVV